MNILEFLGSGSTVKGKEVEVLDSEIQYCL